MKATRTFEVIAEFHRPLVRGLNAVSKNTAASGACLRRVFVAIAVAMVRWTMNSFSVVLCVKASAPCLDKLSYADI